MSRLGESGGTRAVARLYAQMLTGMRPNVARTVVTGMASTEAGEQVQAAFWDKDGSCPAHCLGWTEAEAFVLIDGVSDSTQAGNLMRRYKSSILGPDQEPVNAMIVSCADVISAHVRSIPFRLGGSVTIAGYSLGGAIACMIFKEQAANPWLQTNRQVISIAAPRVSNVRDCQDMRAAGPVFRWFCDDDPIPYCPLHPDESFAFAVFSGRFDSVQYSRFLHPVTGIEVKADGTTSAQMLPTQPPALPATDMVAWYFGAMGGTPPSHLLDTFIGRIPLDLRAGKDFIHPPAGGPEQHTFGERHDRDAAARQVANNIVALERRQQETPVRIPELQIVRAKRIGRVWGVYFGEKLIVVRPGRRTARHIARSLNEVLDRLQSSAYVNASAIPQLFKDYLDQAADPNGGFVPVMNTQL